ncbi:transglutaminase domain-containing protein [Oligoflexia bacterium]|nr:transglutaminase domain-containing protein [Oligoflexia bacterium]
MPLNRKRTLLVVIALIIMIVLVYFLVHHRSVASKTVQYETRTVRYSFGIRNSSNALVAEDKIQLFAPVKQTSFQITSKLTASTTFESLTDSLGNQALQAVLTIPPFGSKYISVEAQVKMSSEGIEQALINPALFLAKEKYIEIDHSDIIALAKQLKADRPVETVNNIFDWVTRNIKSTAYLPEGKGARYAIDKREGDCTEFASLFIALCRVNNIPARLIGGFVVEKDMVLHARDYHNWAEFYEQNIWQIADPQEQVLRKSAGRYLALKIHSNTEEAKISSLHRFRAESKNIEIKMD